MKYEIDVIYQNCMINISILESINLLDLAKNFKLDVIIKNNELFNKIPKEGGASEYKLIQTPSTILKKGVNHSAVGFYNIKLSKSSTVRLFTNPPEFITTGCYCDVCKEIGPNPHKTDCQKPSIDNLNYTVEGLITYCSVTPLPQNDYPLQIDIPLQSFKNMKRYIYGINRYNLFAENTKKFFRDELNIDTNLTDVPYVSKYKYSGLKNFPGSINIGYNTYYKKGISIKIFKKSVSLTTVPWITRKSLYNFIFSKICEYSYYQFNVTKVYISSVTVDLNLDENKSVELDELMKYIISSSYEKTNKYFAGYNCFSKNEKTKKIMNLSNSEFKINCQFFKSKIQVTISYYDKSKSFRIEQGDIEEITLLKENIVKLINDNKIYTTSGDVGSEGREKGEGVGNKSSEQNIRKSLHQVNKDPENTVYGNIPLDQYQVLDAKGNIKKGGKVREGVIGRIVNILDTKKMVWKTDSNGKLLEGKIIEKDPDNKYNILIEMKGSPSHSPISSQVSLPFNTIRLVNKKQTVYVCRKSITEKNSSRKIPCRPVPYTFNGLCPDTSISFIKPYGIQSNNGLYYPCCSKYTQSDLDFITRFILYGYTPEEKEYYNIVDNPNGIDKFSGVINPNISGFVDIYAYLPEDGGESEKSQKGSRKISSSPERQEEPSLVRIVDISSNNKKGQEKAIIYVVKKVILDGPDAGNTYGKKYNIYADKFHHIYKESRLFSGLNKLFNGDEEKIRDFLITCAESMKIIEPREIFPLINGFASPSKLTKPIDHFKIIQVNRLNIKEILEDKSNKVMVIPRNSLFCSLRVINSELILTDYLNRTMNTGIKVNRKLFREEEIYGFASKILGKLMFYSLDNYNINYGNLIIKRSGENGRANKYSYIRNILSFKNPLEPIKDYDFVFFSEKNIARWCPGFINNTVTLQIIDVEYDKKAEANRYKLGLYSSKGEKIEIKGLEKFFNFNFKFFKNGNYVKYSKYIYDISKNRYSDIFVNVKFNINFIDMGQFKLDKYNPLVEFDFHMKGDDVFPTYAGLEKTKEKVETMLNYISEDDFINNYELLE